MMKYYDLSHKIENGMPVYPGDTGVSLEQVKRLEIDCYNAYALSTGMHAGTHVDCPMHLLGGTKRIAEYPLENFAGRGCLIDARGEKEITYKTEYNSIQPGDIVLILTGMAGSYGREEYYEDHPVISMELTRFMVSRKIRMLGVDMPSPDNPPFPVHKLLLGNGIFILENLTGLEQLLNLKTDFEVFAVPLRIAAEASLVRAFAKVVRWRDGMQ